MTSNEARSSKGLKIRVDKVVANDRGLFLGLIVHYSEHGPIRFARVELEDDVLDWQALSDLTVWLARQANRHMDRERELDDMLPLDSE